jgi:hypothetical protein
VLKRLRRWVLGYEGDRDEDDGSLWEVSIQPFGWPHHAHNVLYVGPLGKARDELHYRQLADKWSGDFGRTLYFLRRLKEKEVEDE